MIQRSQSVYLGLAALCLLAVPFFFFAEISAAAGSYTYNARGLNASVPDGIPLDPLPFETLYLWLALGIYSILILLNFKKRKLQLVLVKLGYILLLASILLIYYGVNQLKSPADEVLWGIGFFLPVSAFAFYILAHRGIHKDEKLIRSIDRLR